MPESRILYPERPVWEPLIKAVGDKCEEFMFMGMVPLGCIWIFLYKHIATRRYLNLDGRGGAYSYNRGRYHPVELNHAVEHAMSIKPGGDLLHIISACNNH